MLMWVMSDRAIPRSYRMMQGFGVHTFRFVNAAGESRFVKFHWTPVAGTHSLVWDEAVKISGADSDFHRRDLWEAIEAGAYPEWELGVQVFTRRATPRGSASTCSTRPRSFPKSWCRCSPIGRMVLNRNPDNFFAETEQVAFCTAHIVPGHRLQQRSAARRPHPFLRRHADHAAGRPELPRDPDQRAGRAGAQQPARRHASAGDPARARGVRAELARRRLPVPGRHEGVHVVSAADGRAQGARQAGEVRRALQPGDAVLEQPERRREAAHHQRVPLRAHESADAWPMRKRVVARLRNVADELAQRVARRPRHRSCPTRCRRCSARTPRAGGRSRRPRCRCSRGPATAASRRGASRSSSPTASMASRCARCTQRLTQRGAVPRFVGQARTSREHERRADRSRSLDGSGPGRAVRRRRAAGRRGRRRTRSAHARSRDGVHQGPVSALQADPRVRRVERRCSRARAFLPRYRRANKDPGVLLCEESNVAKPSQRSSRPSRASAFRARDAAAAGLSRAPN